MNFKLANDKLINFSPHAKEKIKRLAQSGITEEKAIETIRNRIASLQAILEEKSLKQH